MKQYCPNCEQITIWDYIWEDLLERTVNCSVCLHEKENDEEEYPEDYDWSD